MKKQLTAAIFVMGLFSAPSFAGDDDFIRCLFDAEVKAVKNPWQLESLRRLCLQKYPPINSLGSLLREMEEREKPENKVLGMCQMLLNGKPFGSPYKATKGYCGENQWRPLTPLEK